MLAAAAASAVVVLVGATTLAAPPVEARMVTHQLSIPAQDLGEALKALSAAADEQVLFSDQIVRGKKSGELEGSFTTDQALDLLLKGSGLKAERTPSGVLLIKDPGVPAPAVKPAEKRDEEAGRRAGFWDRFRVAQANVVASEVKEEGQSTQVEEVVVTATKRAENIRDVPLSITAITAKDIEQRGLVNAEDYLRGIPGTNQTDMPWGGQAIIIRGLETSLAVPNAGSGATTASYFGETPTTVTGGLNGSNVDIKLVDVQRVEVLRGPQGTAFGNASMGGAVRVIPVAPRLDRLEGKVNAGYGATSGNGGGNYNLQAVGNVPLIDDKLAIRAVAYKFSDSGYYRNIAGSDPAFQQLAASQGAQAFAVNGKEEGSAETTGARIAAAFQPSNELNLTLSFLTQETAADGYGTATARGYDQAIFQVAPEHVYRGQKEGIADRNVDIANAMLDYDLSWGNLIATYSYIDGTTQLAHPYSEAPFPWAASDGRSSTTRGNVAEIRLVTKLNGAWNFIGGLYEEKYKDHLLTTIVFNAADPTTLFPGATSRQVYLSDWHRESRQKAAFGEVSWELVPDLTLTGGARIYKYDRSIDNFAGGYLVGGEQLLQEDTDDSGSIFRGNLSYKINDDALVYAGWSQGFRLGLPQAPLPVTCDQNSDGIVDGMDVPIAGAENIHSDSVDNYELGSKFALLDRRLVIDATLFRMDWTDIPIGLTPACGFPFTTNAGQARSEGLELQADFQLTHSSRVSLGGSWTHARLTEDVPLASLHVGDRLPGSAEVNANLGLLQEFELAGRPASLRADAIYVGPFDSNVVTTPNTEAGSYVKLDLAARMVFQRLAVDLYVRNVTNEDAFTMRSAYGVSSDLHGYRLRPRTVGVQFGYDF